MDVNYITSLQFSYISLIGLLGDTSALVLQRGGAGGVQGDHFHPEVKVGEYLYDHTMENQTQHLTKFICDI